MLSPDHNTAARGQRLLLMGACLLLVAFKTGLALANPPAGAPPTDRIIVKWRATGIAAVQMEALSERTSRLRTVTGLELRSVRSVGARLDVVRLANSSGESSMRAALARLNTDPAIEYAEADERIYILAAPNDPRFVAGSDALGSWQGQWYLGAPTATAPAAINATTAWATTTGTGIIIAVVDTGIRMDHPDLAGQLLAGRDFVCNDNLNLTCQAAGATLFLTANDGDGWDTDPSDPGDWISSADVARSDGFFANNKCGGGTNHDQPVDSTWHGTRVAGLIAAVTNNGIGIASVAPNARIVPVRAIGKCAGYTSDLVAAMLWAGGISDSSLSGIPAIGQRANIINLSLGNRSACDQSEQSAVDQLTAAGILVVAAAGNDGGPIGAPANCTGVLSVGGIRHIGTKVGYSNVSSTAAAISIAAPAGNCVNVGVNLPCLFSIDTLTNEGRTTPLSVTDNPSTALTSYTYSVFNAGYTGNQLNAANVGTSFAAPLVSGVAALMASANGQLTRAEVIARMRQSATPFPVPAATPTGGVCHVAALTKNAAGDFTDVQNSDCQCTTATCGAGMLNATAAISAALRPIALIVSSATVASIGQRISLDGSTSLAASGHQIVGYQWSVVPSIAVSNATGAVAEIVFPATRPITVTLTITDEGGRQDSASLTIDPTLTASSSSSGGSGGGAMGLELLALTLLLLARLSRTELNPAATVAMLCSRAGH